MIGDLRDELAEIVVQGQLALFLQDGDDRPLNPPAKHIAVADTKYHLGTADPEKIELVKIGYDKDIFV